LPSTPSSTRSDAASAPPDPAGGPTRRARWILAGIALVVVLTVGVVTWVVVAGSGGSGSSSTEIVPKVLSAKVGQVAPNFSLPTLDGGHVELSDYRGTPVVLNFWASWCTPCRAEFPLLREQVASDPAVALVGVNTQDFVRADGRKFAEHQHANWPNGFDRDQAVRRGYGVNGLPETFFIDAKGVIRSHVILGLTKPVLDQQLAKITR
jgi:cytochrome c biogenesis protein CcmG/thiol:disulfide interchange protein DsbE